MLETVWFWLVKGSPMSKRIFVGTPATAAASERVWRIPSRSARPLSYQWAGSSLRWNVSGPSIGGSGVSSVGVQVAALKFFVSPDGEDAPARLARPAEPTTAASRKRAGSPSSFLLPCLRG